MFVWGETKVQICHSFQHIKLSISYFRKILGLQPLPFSHDSYPSLSSISVVIYVGETLSCGECRNREKTFPEVVKIGVMLDAIEYLPAHNIHAALICLHCG
jgi:hypothetical protein